MEYLRVESYDHNEVEDKKKLIKKRAVLASGAVLVTLGLFGLTGCDDSRRLTEQPSQTPHYTEFWNGGSGSWFVSFLERSA